jgi:hypothetical protein
MTPMPEYHVPIVPAHRFNDKTTAQPSAQAAETGRGVLNLE